MPIPFFAVQRGGSDVVGKVGICGHILVRNIPLDKCHCCDKPYCIDPDHDSTITMGYRLQRNGAIEGISLLIQGLISKGFLDENSIRDGDFDECISDALCGLQRTLGDT